MVHPRPRRGATVDGVWRTSRGGVVALLCAGGALVLAACGGSSLTPSGSSGVSSGPTQASSTQTGSAQGSATPAVGDGSPSPTVATQPPSSRPTPTTVATRAQPCLHTVLVGYSVRHRAITACERGTPGGVSLVVVGVIHGNERLGLSVVDRLRLYPVPPGVDLWTISTVNPDGLAAGTRQNAHHVDLNRNWPGTWQPSSPSSATYGGPSAASEPETRALRDFLLHLRPRTVVVFHSPLDAVDFSEGADPAVTRHLAQASGYPARTLGARPGSFTGWFNQQAWDGTAVTFEFASTATSSQLTRVARALVQLATWRRG